MVLTETLNEISRRITQQTNAEQIILFGSHVWGDPSEDSDLDLLVIVPESGEPSHKRATRIHRILRGIPVSCDIIVRTRDEVARLNPVRSSLIYRAFTEGRKLNA